MSDSGAPSSLDLTVLAHLRGYPEELKRFTNLMKQAHTQGRGAVDFFLTRAPAGDSFLVALCRYVAGGVAIATVVEAAALLRIPPSAVLDRAAAGSLPCPLWGEGRHQLWRRDDLLRVAPSGDDQRAGGA